MAKKKDTSEVGRNKPTSPDTAERSEKPEEKGKASEVDRTEPDVAETPDLPEKPEPVAKSNPTEGRDTASEDSPPGAKPKVGAREPNLVVELYTGVSERTVEESAWYWKSQQKPYNSDDLYRKTGDYRIYEEMLVDDQVKTCVQIKRDLIVGSGWTIKGRVSDDSHDEIIKDVRTALEDDPEVGIEDMCEEILSGDSFGFSLSEKLFRNRDDGSLTLRNIKTRHPSTWLIHTDKHGNVTKYEQQGRSENLTIDPKSLIHYVNNRAFQNPYGTSDLRAAYNAYFIKRQVVKWYAMFLEKHASPTPIGRYDSGVDQAAVDAIFLALKKLQTATAMTIPKTIEMDYLESKSNGEAYEKALNIFNMFIGRAMMIPDLLGFQGSETGGGSYALGKDQIRILFLHILRRRRTLEALINKHVVWPIIVYNHGFVEDYPQFKLNPISDEQVEGFVKLWLECVKGKTYKPSDQEINHFRKIVQFPEGDVEREAPPVTIGPDGKPIAPKEGAVDDNGKPIAPDAGDDDAVPASGKDAGEPSGKEPEGEKDGKKGKPKAFAAKVFEQCAGEYDKKVDYAGISSSMDRFKSRVLDEAMPIVRRVFESLYDQIKAKKILQTQDNSKLESLKTPYLRELNSLLRSALRDGWKEGRAIGQREILKGAFRAPLPDDAFLQYLENETFQYVGDWGYNVTKKARVTILEAIRDGKPLSAVLDLLDEEGVTDSMVSLERFARTKFTDVMNRGRVAAFNDSGVVAAYQYSAILDDRTTPICAGLHGKIFKNGDEPIPPMHFNCRSLLVPITKYEAFEADEEVGGTSIDDFIDANKGDGFARR